MRYLLYIFLLIFITRCKPKAENSPIAFPEKTVIPSSIKNTHVKLLAQIHQFTLIQDSSGRVALKIEDFMQHHFKEEEDFMLPTLGLLPLLINGQLPEKKETIIALSEKATAAMDHMSAEHQLITAYIKELKQASKKDNLPKVIAFENDVVQHAESEEEVFFPTAILIGEYLKLKTTSKP